MKTLTLTQEISDTKIRFSMLVLSMAICIVFGSFFLIGYLRFNVQKQLFALSALRYRIEYITHSQNMSLLAAAGDALSADTLSASSANRTAQGIPVLTYHSVLPDKSDDLTTVNTSFEGANISLSHFKDQMFALKAAGWHTISYEDFDAFIHGKKQLPEKSFLLTFDDGAKNSFYPVEPILDALDYRAVAFILPDHSLGSNSTYYLNKNELGLMLSTEHWDIESHGQDIHVSLPVVADGSKKENALSNRVWLPQEGRLETHEEYRARITNDLADSKTNLEQALNVDVSGFAFPFGDYGQNVSNDPQAEATVLAVARSQYGLVFYQNWNRGEFSFNYPSTDAFMIKRIPVDPAWGGAQLLEKLETGIPKVITAQSTFATQDGWQIAWGEGTTSAQGLRLFAATTTTGALALLDGSLMWSNYTVEMPVVWHEGYAILLFDMQNDRSGRACVFSSDGWVQLQDRTPDDIFILRESKHANVSAGAHTIGAVSMGTTTACVFDGTYVIDADLPPSSGGVGAEAWSQDPGNAELFIKNTLVNKNK